MKSDIVQKQKAAAGKQKKIKMQILLIMKQSMKSKINKITITKKYGRRYFTRSVFYSLDADDVDNNTKDMEESIVKRNKSNILLMNSLLIDK